MITFARSLGASAFTRKYPRSHVIVGHYDPAHLIEQHEPTRLGMLTTCINSLDTIGEYSMVHDPDAHTIRLSFEFAEDAAKVADMVHAKADEGGDHEGHASMSSFKFNRRRYLKLGYIRAKRIREIEAAIMRGEG